MNCLWRKCMDSILAKFKKEIKDFIYKACWELQDKNFETNNQIVETQADIVEAMMDEFNAL